MRLIDMPLIELLPATAYDAYWSERGTRAMGSRARIVAGDAPDGVVDWAMSELERLEQCWSRFRDDSELSQLNARAGEWTDVSPSMLLALTCALDLHDVTGGRFDPTILDALERRLRVPAHRTARTRIHRDRDRHRRRAGEAPARRTGRPRRHRQGTRG
jgi:thiamine biosynthesis lipoprotein ApbE